MRSFFVQYWFLIGLLIGMFAGWMFATPLETVNRSSAVRSAIVMAVMFAMALPLPLAEILTTLRRPWPAVLASTLNFGLLPALAWWMSAWLSSDFQAGLMVVAATPCTLASAAVWTRRAGGNDVTALMTTIITNGLCFAVTPLIVFILLRQQTEIAVGEMILRLAILVLMPIAVAQMIAWRKRIGDWARKNKRSLSVAAQIGILLIVILGTAQTSLKLDGGEVEGQVWSWVVLLWTCSLLHVTALVLGYGAARSLGLDRSNQIAVAFSGSQKTLMIGLVVCIHLGVSLLPMVIYHAVQLLLDTPIAHRFASSAQAQSSAPS